MNSDHQYWDFSSVACHARALLEGNLYFHYFIAPENDELEEGRARITLMQLNDCCSRMKIFETVPEQRQWFENQAEQLRDRLRSIRFFQQLSTSTQNSCLSGKKAWFFDRQQLVEAVGWEKADFDVLWDLWSQHSHIHPVSFLRMEPNARGSGLECDPDRLYIAKAMLISASIVDGATDKIVEVFPDGADQRRGVDSEFSPGPASNAPVHLT
ncbi:hypothetical protein [Luteimonas sp. SDU101]|uniref:hypothetical protein n=1 Tax=Luteimonas sp. SDU101 TaxID=3422593 RepID=UPI003EC0B527